SQRAIESYRTIRTEADAPAVVFSADSNHLHTFDYTGSLITWDAAARVETKAGPSQLAMFLSARFSPDATKVFFSNPMESVVSNKPMEFDRLGVVWDLARDQEVFRLQTSRLIKPVFTTDGRRVAHARFQDAQQQDRVIAICDARTGETLTEFQVEMPEPR